MIDDEEIIDEGLDELLDDEAADGGEQQLYEHLRLEVDRGQVPLRIDKYLTEHTQHSSRNRIQQAAEAGFLFVNDRPVKSNYKVRAGDVITLKLNRPHFDTTIVPEEMPLDVRYQDDDLMVVYKPAGLVVHPGCGNFHGTLVHAVAWHLRNLPSYDPNDPQVGLVHRIDKDTSGLLVVAKTPEAKANLGKQFFGLAIRAGNAFGTRREHKLGAIGGDEVAALDAHVFGHRDDEPIPAGGGEHRQTHARVARGRFNQGALARRDDAALFGIVENRLRDAVLRRTARVEELDFAENGCLTVRKRRYVHKRRVADKFLDVSVNPLRHCYPAFRIPLLSPVFVLTHYILWANTMPFFPQDAR